MGAMSPVWRGSHEGRPVKVPLAAQQATDVLRQRQHWFDGQFDLKPERLVFIDETLTATNLTRSHGRCAKGVHLRAGFPRGHRKNHHAGRHPAHDRHGGADGAGRPNQRRVVRGLRGPGPRSRTAAGVIVIRDHPSSRRQALVQVLIEPASANLRFLPPYRPRLQSYRESILAPQSYAAHSRRANRRRPAGPDRQLVDISNAPTTSAHADMIQNERIPLWISDRIDMIE